MSTDKVMAQITDLTQWEFAALAELQERITVEMARRGVCPKCWEVFASHNDDGSCVDYPVTSDSYASCCDTHARLGGNCK